MFSAEDTKKIEEMYKAKYVCTTCLKDSRGWFNSPVSIFYSEKKHPEGSNYFGLYYNGFNELMMVDGISATEPFHAIKLENGDIIFSRYRHDYYRHGDVAVDGGRDYLETQGEGFREEVTLQIVKDELIEKDIQ